MDELETVGRAVKRLQYRHHRAMEVGLIAVGTTLAQWDALRAISRNPGASAHSLALATFQSDQSFGTLANRLVAQKLIERRPGVGRRIEHHLTADGEAMLAKGFPVAESVLEASFTGLSQRERATLLDLLERAISGTGLDAT
jgi:DNA-binding MarR family transcriptional regulator